MNLHSEAINMIMILFAKYIMKSVYIYINLYFFKRHKRHIYKPPTEAQLILPFSSDICSICRLCRSRAHLKITQQHRQQQAASNKARDRLKSSTVLSPILV